MNHWKLGTWIFISLFTFTTSFSYAQQTIKDRATGKSFPSTVNVMYDGKDQDLTATGVSTRKKFFVKVYSVAHYMQDPQGRGNTAFNYILNSDKTKELSFIWVRDVSSKKLKDGYKESFNSAMGRGKSQSEINQFLNFFKNPVRNGDKHVFIWYPDNTIEVLINNESAGTIKNEAFAKGLWSIWFGKKSVVNRNDLVSRMR